MIVAARSHDSKITIILAVKIQGHPRNPMVTMVCLYQLNHSNILSDYPRTPSGDLAEKAIDDSFAIESSLIFTHQRVIKNLVIFSIVLCDSLLEANPYGPYKSLRFQVAIQP